ncbi:hypothetical protein HQQ80_03005 [Microbacteriaceae bacterium VKM Ac-2855]|nr:hypothetical protein [Microbacteriaceae bacterium VKM Ac-2855]
MRRVEAASVVVIALMLTGCTQVAAIAPVGGDRVSNVRYATLDVLVAEGVELLAAPDCVESDRSVTCTGSTVDGTVITATSAATTEDHLEIVVGTSTLFSGSISAVIEDAVDGVVP